MKPIDRKNWVNTSFGEVCYNVNNTEKDPLAKGIERYVGLEHIESENLQISTWGNVADGTTFTKKFKKGQVLFGKRRAYLKKVAIAEFDGVCSGDILVFEANENKIDKNLFPFLVKSESFFDFAIRTSAGSLSPRTKFQDLTKFDFLLPPKEQHAQLAELLWAADEVVKSYEELLKRIEISQTVYSLDNFQDKSKPAKTISSIAQINPSIPKKLSNPDIDVSFLTMADVSENGKIINKQKRSLRDVRKGFTYFGEGDTLFAKITPCMENGKGALAKELSNGIGFGSTEFHIIRPLNKSDELYCYYLSRMTFFRKEAEKLMVGSAGQKRVQSNFFDYFTLQIPDELARYKFGETMNMLEKEKDKAIELRLLAKQIQKHLINQIFSV